MTVTSVPPPRSMLLQSPQGSKVLLAKATFSLSEGQLELISDAEPFLERDDRDSYGRILRPGDAIERPTPLVVVKGRAQPGAGSHAISARIRVGNVDSSVEVPIERALEDVLLSLELDELVAGTAISIEGMHPMRTVFTTSLPTRVPVATLRRARGAELRPLALRLLFVDVDRSVCTLTYSAVVVRAGDEPAELSLEWGEHTEIAAAQRFTIPTMGPSADLERSTTMQIDLPEDPPTADVPMKRATLEVATKSGRSATALPFVDSSRGSGIRPPSAVGQAPLVRASAPPPRPPSRETRTVGELAASPSKLGPSAREAGAFRSVEAPRAEVPALDPRAEELREAARRGAGAASDEAARRDSVSPATAASLVATADGARSERVEAIRLLFWDEARLDNILDQARWQACLILPPIVPPAAVPKRGEPPPAPPEKESNEAKQGRKIQSLHNILARGAADKEVRGLADLPSDVNGAPMVLLSGALELPLNEVELLQATCDAAQPSAKNDKRLKELLDATEELLRLPLAASTEYVLQLLSQIRETWSKANRTLPQNFLVTNVERALLEKRVYTKRNLLGGEHARGLIRLQQSVVPLYIPIPALAKLPLMLTFPARAVVEVHPSQDGLDPGDFCLRALAIGRLLNINQAGP